MAVFEDNTISHDITTNAGFQAWVQKIEAALTGVGLVVVADSGDLDPATVSTPGTNSTDAGYRIYRFDDAEQATDPIFLKVFYGRGGAATTPRLQLAVGTASDGAGTLTAPSTTRTIAPSQSPSGSGYVSASFREGGLQLHWAADAASTSTNALGLFVVERCRKSSDESLHAGSIAVWTFSLGSPIHDCRTAGAWSNNTGLGGEGGSAAASGEVVLGRLRPGIAIGAFAPLRAIALGRTGVVGASDTGNLPIAGAAKAYKRTPASGVVTARDLQSASTNQNVVFANS